MSHKENTMKKYLYVGAFGFFGTILRFAIKNIHFKYSSYFPVNTIIINITGSFALAFVFALALNYKKINENLKLGITTGFIGTYTTFATFCKDTFGLIEKGYFSYAIIYILVSIGIGVLAILLGSNLAGRFKFKSEDEQDNSA
jgi:CrcB protein